MRKRSISLYSVKTIIPASWRGILLDKSFPFVFTVISGKTGHEKKVANYYGRRDLAKLQRKETF